MKYKLKTYIPWALVMVIPSVFCVVLNAIQLHNLNLFFGINWAEGFNVVFYRIVSDLVKLLQPLAGLGLCILAVLRPFSQKTNEFMIGMRWITAVILVLFSVSFCIYSGIHGLFFNTVWDWIADILRVAVIPVAVAFLLIAHTKLELPIRWTLSLIIVGLMAVHAVSEVTAAAEGRVVDAIYIIASALVTVCQICPVLFALIPRKNTEPKE